MTASPDLDRTLAALADPTRRAIVDRLRRGPRRAGDLADDLGITPPALSRHLRVLRRNRVVTGAELATDARVRLYRLEPEPFAQLRVWLDEVERFWGGQLAAFKAHAERRGAKR